MAIHLNPLRTTPHPTPRAAAPPVRKPETPLPSSRAAAASGTTTPATANPPAPSWMATFNALFSGKSSNTVVAAPVAPPPPPPPTPESVFGGSPWLDNPAGESFDGSIYGFNPQYFATPQTAALVAKMVGGTVVAVNQMTSAPASPFHQQQPNLMVRLKNGTLINPGTVAGFYTHGYPQSIVDQMIANEVANSST